MTNQEVQVLLVEDNLGDAELAIRALKRNNLVNNLIHLTDGVQALEFIFRTGKYADRDKDQFPKVILLDLKMPKISGMQVLEKVKSDPATKSIPVVILTSSAEDPDIKKCYELGANGYIVKPVDFANFSKALGEIGFYWIVINRV